MTNKFQKGLLAFVVLALIATFAYATAPGSKNDLAYYRFDELQTGTLDVTDEIVYFEGDVPKQGKTVQDLLNLVDDGNFALVGQFTYGSMLITSETVTEANVITAAEAGKTFYLDAAAGFASTLPAASTVTAGTKFKFVVKTAPTSGAYTVITGNSLENILIGGINELEVDTGDDGPYLADGDTITFVQSTAVVGDFVVLESDGTSWYLYGQANADGGITITQAD